MTTTPSASTTWTSWHLHLATDAPSAQDRVIREVLRPVVASLAGRPWFFLRFWQAGTHIRFRVGDLSAAEAARVQDALADHLDRAGRPAPGERPVDEATYRALATAQAASEYGADRVVQPMLPPGVHRAEYHPEYGRYGGVPLMPFTEHLFQLSSEAVLRVLPHAATIRDRTALGLRGTMAAAAALGDRDARAEFYARSMAAWRSFAAGWDSGELDRLCRVEGATGPAPDPDRHGPFTAWHVGLTELAARLAEPGPIVFSHVHMLHNRLGRSLHEELRTYAWLAHVFPEAARR
ncbi:thiopeptide-type bacteriocin biosynthesis protein [Dactylosporangium sp. NPDC051484]|uniref:thiopeptide-type bacteriocin biosynthesis protein n=1 Tax=Dactylosporangium sp. NPDC051484 TaxID=3154942 RepID=UPI00344E5C9E